MGAEKLSTSASFSGSRETAVHTQVFSWSAVYGGAVIQQRIVQHGRCCLQRADAARLYKRAPQPLHRLQGSRSLDSPKQAAKIAPKWPEHMQKTPRTCGTAANAGRGLKPAKK